MTIKISFNGTAYVAQGDDTDDSFTAGGMYSGIPWLMLGGKGDDHLTGGIRNDQIHGEDGDDELDGGDGDDILSGGWGNDRLVGGSGADWLLGDANADWLHGGGGNDNLEGGTGDDHLYGDGGDDSLRGGSGEDFLYGGAGNDYLHGGYEADTLYGGTGNDTYVISMSTTVHESANEGTDTVVLGTAGDYWIVDHVENVRVADWVTGDVSIQANDLDNVVTGGVGDDAIRGGKGNDTLRGGKGDDFYTVTDLGDQVIENAGEGIDTVSVGPLFSSGYTLGANIEKGSLLHSGDANLSGNALDNVLTGNESANTLEGEAGADVLVGNGGVDTLSGGDGNDAVYGGSGNDDLSGGAGGDWLDGGNDDDVLCGGAGRDELTGGAGRDVFVYLGLSDSQGYGVDRIADFTKGMDRIDLSAIDADATAAGNQAFNFVGSGKPMFTSAGDLWITYARNGTASLYGDVDGDGVEDLRIDLTGVTSGVTAADLLT